MEKFQLGTICYHKATDHKCVVIKITNEMIKVRDEMNTEQEYFPIELITEDEYEEQNSAKFDA